MASHLTITGMPGTGKTTKTAQIISQLVNSGISVLVLEPARPEYGNLLRQQGIQVTEYGDLDYANVKALAENPFALDPNCRLRVWKEMLQCCIVSAFSMSESPLPLHLSALLNSVYKDFPTNNRFINTDKIQYPTVSNFLDAVKPYIQNETCSGREVSQNIEGALTARARALSSYPELCTRVGLLANDLLDFGATAKILRLSDFGPEQAKFLGMIFVSRILAHARTADERELHTVVVLEEAHSLFIDSKTGEETAFSRLYETTLAELRRFGIGFITIDQRPSLLPNGVLANSRTKIAFANTHGEDRNAIRLSMGLSNEQSSRFGSLEVGTALYQTSGINGALTIYG